MTKWDIPYSCAVSQQLTGYTYKNYFLIYIVVLKSSQLLKGQAPLRPNDAEV